MEWVCREMRQFSNKSFIFTHTVKADDHTFPQIGMYTSRQTGRPGDSQNQTQMKKDDKRGMETMDGWLEWMDGKEGSQDIFRGYIQRVLTVRNR